MTKEKSIYPNSLDTRVALLEQSIGMINQTLVRIETNMHDGFRDLREDMKDLKKDVKSDFRWLVGLMIAFGTGLLGVMAHGFHWI